MSKKRKSLLLVCSVLLVVCLAIGATLAYFTATDSKRNEFNTGGKDGSETDVDIETEEPGWDPGDGDEIMPGEIIPKDPALYNGTGDVYARMKLQFTELKPAVVTAAYTSYAATLGGSKTAANLTADEKKAALALVDHNDPANVQVIKGAANEDRLELLYSMLLFDSATAASAKAVIDPLVASPGKDAPGFDAALKAAVAPIYDAFRYNGASLKKISSVDLAAEARYNATDFKPYAFDSGTGLLTEIVDANIIDTLVDKGEIYFYYQMGTEAPATAWNRILEAKTTSNPLFNFVVIPWNWDKAQFDIIGDFDIVIQGEAIQTTGFFDEDGAPYSQTKYDGYRQDAIVGLEAQNAITTP